MTRNTQRISFVCAHLGRGGDFDLYAWNHGANVADRLIR